MNNKQILDNAPEGATHWDRLQYYRIRFADSLNIAWDVFNQVTGKWFDAGDRLTDVYKIRALSDIRTIIEQQERINELLSKLKILLALHDEEVFISDPWEEAFEEVEKLLPQVTTSNVTNESHTTESPKGREKDNEWIYRWC